MNNQKKIKKQFKFILFPFKKNNNKFIIEFLSYRNICLQTFDRQLEEKQNKYVKYIYIIIIIVIVY